VISIWGAASLNERIMIFRHLINKKVVLSRGKPRDAALLRYVLCTHIDVQRKNQMNVKVNDPRLLFNVNGRLNRTLAVLGVVGLGKSRSADAHVIIDEVDAVAEWITRIILTFVQFYVHQPSQSLLTYSFVLIYSFVRS